VLGLEIRYVQHVLLVGICFLVLGKFGMKFLLGLTGY
jgi:hypothetical protein